MFLLEGGYDIGALARSVAATIETATGAGGADEQPAGELALTAAGHYARWWPDLQHAAV